MSSLFTVIAGVMVANVLTVFLLYGLREGLRHTDDRTMPGWAWWCIAAPMLVLAACIYVAGLDQGAPWAPEKVATNNDRDGFKFLGFEDTGLGEREGAAKIPSSGWSVRRID